MKTIGIIGAMDIEIAGIKAKMNVTETKTAIGTEFHIGTLAGKNVVLALAGIGKVNAAICAQIMIDLMGVDAIISVGVAGAIADGLRVGDVVIATDLIYHDMDSTHFGYSPGIIPRMSESVFAADAALSAVANEVGHEILSGTGNKILAGRMATGDQFINSGEDKERISNIFAAACCEMESAAIAHTCYLNKTPFAAIRAISDGADDDASLTFEEFLEVAAERSGRIVVGMVRNIN